MARAVTTGISQLIDPYGRVLGSVELVETGFLVAKMPPSKHLTPYVRWGDWPAYAAVFAVVGLFGFRRKMHTPGGTRQS
jgi:apolipoprotein N-acyltransferase